jgi:hypothetical protein
MPELPTCDCISGFPPYDRLTFIYQAAAELSGDTTLPSADCVAGVPPFDRFAYIYAAFRVLAEDDSLPSQECIEGESYQDQVTRIYEAARIYAGDDGLPAVECVRGLPIWQQWDSIYAALYSAAGEPDELEDPTCVGPNFDVLSGVYCALLTISIPCVTPVLVSATINGDILTLVFSEEVTGTEGFLIEIEGDSPTLTYTSGEGTDTLVFTTDPPGANPGEEVLLDYTPGNVTNQDCPLASFEDFVVTNNTGVEFTYLRPGGVDTYFRPDGVSQYIRP